MNIQEHKSVTILKGVSEIMEFLKKPEHIQHLFSVPEIKIETGKGRQPEIRHAGETVMMNMSQTAPNELLWHFEGKSTEAGFRLRVQDAPAGRGSEVILQASGNFGAIFPAKPDKSLIEGFRAVKQLIQEGEIPTTEPGDLLAEGLRAIKQLLEAGEIPTIQGQPQGY